MHNILEKDGQNSENTNIYIAEKNYLWKSKELYTKAVRHQQYFIKVRHGA